MTEVPPTSELVVQALRPSTESGPGPFQPGRAEDHTETVATHPAPRLVALADRELSHILYRRLIVVGCLGSWIYGMYCASLLASQTSFDQDSASLVLMRTYALAAAAMLAWLGVVLATRGKGLRWQRGMELVAVAVIMLAAASAENLGYVTYGSLAQSTGPVFARASVLSWLALIAGYGLLIPNTTRRAAAVVGVMTGVAVASMLCLWLRLELRPGQLLNWLTILVIYLGGAAVAMAFASGRLEAARRAMAQARELGQYRLGRRLGKGAMGEVFLAEHRLLKRPCAVKLIRPEKAADEAFIRRFEREVQAVTRLTHPAAVQVYDYGRADDGAFFYVMEYLPGMTLDEVVGQAGPLPPGRVISILRQMCGALAEAHAQGLVHRDVKPGNVMICLLGGRADAAKLLDFGLVAEPASAETRLTQVGGVLGTPAYMSPEQARGAEVGPASDLYALGALGYFLLTGRPPFSGVNILEVLHAHLTQPVVPPSAVASAVPSDLEAVVLRLLAKDPADRFATASHVEAALASCDPCGWSDAAAAAWWESIRARSVA